MSEEDFQPGGDHSGVREEVRVTQHDPPRVGRRARGVLQVRNIIHVEVDRDERIPRRVGYLIDGDDVRPSV